MYAPKLGKYREILSAFVDATVNASYYRLKDFFVFCFRRLSIATVATETPATIVAIKISGLKTNSIA